MKKLKLFKGNVPKAPVEFITTKDGIKVGIRKVQHLRSKNGVQYTYNPTKGWKKISKYNTHNLLNKLFVDNGYGSIYTDKTLEKAYGM